jgi:hypothetical protein
MTKCTGKNEKSVNAVRTSMPLHADLRKSNLTWFLSVNGNNKKSDGGPGFEPNFLVTIFIVFNYSRKTLGYLGMCVDRSTRVPTCIEYVCMYVLLLSISTSVHPGSQLYFFIFQKCNRVASVENLFRVLFITSTFFHNTLQCSKERPPPHFRSILWQDL